MFAFGEVAEGDFAVADALQKRRMAVDCLEHPADLPLLAFFKDYLTLTLFDEGDLAGRRFAVIERDAGLKFFTLSVIHHPTMPDEIFFFVFITRVGEALSQLAVVGQE